MSVRTTTRFGAVAGPLVAAGLLLGACGGGDSNAASSETVVLDTGPTDYLTIPPATTEPETTVSSTPDDEEPDGGSESAIGSTSDYVIKSGDNPSAVAQMFGITLDELQDANPSIDVLTTFISGSTIKIPGGGSSSGSDSSDTGNSNGDDGAGNDTGGSDSASGDDTGGSDSASGDDTGGDDTGVTATGDSETEQTDASSDGACSASTYILKANDSPNVVANRFDITVDELQAANSDIDFASTFPIGYELVIPADPDC